LEVARTDRVTWTVTLVGLAGFGAVAVASGSEDEGPGEERDTPITGIELDRASRAALEHTGEGTVTETEVGDEESYYEVEVTLEDGTQVDVQLDEAFEVVGSETDGTDEED
jgi:uncharacterized membrane protein YkoI